MGVPPVVAQIACGSPCQLVWQESIDLLARRPETIEFDPCQLAGK